MHAGSHILKMLDLSYKGPDFQFNEIIHDTRLLKKGDLFFDLAGNADHCKKAFEYGASAIITPLKNHSVSEIPCLTVEAPRHLFSKACSLFFPRQPDTIAAVTGTNGKTSTVDFIRQLWSALNLPSASFGTLGFKSNRSSLDKAISGLDLPKNLNTLDAYAYHKLLDTLAHYEPQTHFAFEASSHGLVQHRIDHVRVKYAVFTNLTQDHLDYHTTMEAYFEAKAKLFFEILDSKGVAIVNMDDHYGQQLIEGCKQKDIRIVTFSTKNTKADLYARVRNVHEKGMTVYLRAFDHAMTLDIPVVGSFQIDNILAAVAVLLSSTPCQLQDLNQCLSSIKSPEGRMEHVGTKKVNGKDTGEVYVDYAHTPDALLRALQSLRSHVKNQIHVVFGCGGDRDATKRYQMGEIAARHADVVIVTDDNPRSEDPLSIRHQVMEGCASVTSLAIDGGERRDAILKGIQGLQEGDILLIAGKGHEQGQTIGHQTYPFCDKDVAQKYLNIQDGAHSLTAA